MFLTIALHFFKRYQGVPGKLYTGKHRAIPKIKPIHKERALKWLMLAEENSAILSHPYLTMEEEYGHNMTRKQARLKEMVALARAKKWKPPAYMSEHLDHLNVTKKWD